ncbi:hypothetical protein MOSE0_C03994 [Monosporozyma servazzii]
MVLYPMVTITAKGSSTVKILTARCSGLGDLGEPGLVGGLLCKLQSAKQRCTVLYPIVTITPKGSSTVKISYYQRCMVLYPMVTITAKGSSTVKILTDRCSGLGDLGEPCPVGGLLCKLQSAKQRCTVLYPLVTITAKGSSTVKIFYYQRCMVLYPMVTITAKGSSTVKLLTHRCSGLGDLGEPCPVRMANYFITHFH